MLAEGSLKDDWVHLRDLYCRKNTKHVPERGYSLPQVNDQAKTKETQCIKQLYKDGLPFMSPGIAFWPSPNSSFQLPVCVRLCRCNSSLRVKRLPQNVQLHTKGRSPVCHRRWARKWDVFPYTFPQPGMWQICCFFLPGSPELLQKSSTHQVRTEQRTRLACQFHFPHGKEETSLL